MTKERRNNIIRLSFSRRLSLITCAIAGLFFVIITLIDNTWSQRMARYNANSQASIQLEYINLEIGNVLENVEQSVGNLMPSLQTEILRGPVEKSSFSRYLTQIVDNNAEIVGASISFEREFLADRSYFCLYAKRDDDGLIRMEEMGSEDYDYFCMDWYLIPKLLHKAYWTDPYILSHGNKDLVCSYSLPIFTPDSVVVGVITADVAVSYLTKFVNDIKPFPESYNIMIGRDASLIVHPNDDAILAHTIYSYYNDSGDSNWISIAHSMQEGKTGSTTIGSGNSEFFIYYAPVSTSGWSVALVCSNRDIYGLSGGHTKKFLLLALVASLLLFALVRTAVKTVTKPVMLMADSARKVAEGDFDAQLPAVRHNDEIKELRDSLANMTISLKSYISQIKDQAAVQQRIESEFDMAREIQLGMVPKPTQTLRDCPYTDIAAMLRPAREVGGDLYDYYIDQCRSRVYIAIADVSGKGLPAALLMAEVRSMVRSSIYTGSDPATIMELLNDVILETNTSDLFVTIFIGVINPQDETITYCSAGHNPALILSADGTVDEMPTEANVPLGCIPKYQFKEQNMAIRPGQTLYLYTDGISEAENAQLEFYGLNRLKKQLSRCAGLPSQRVIDIINKNINTFIGKNDQNDDITALAVRIHHPRLFPKPFAETITFNRDINELKKLNVLLYRMTRLFDLSDAFVDTLNLALEEVIVNVINYAYPNDNENHQFDLITKVLNHEITFELIDDGIPFDPTSRPEVDINAPLEERSVGGLGIHLVRQIMDSMEYKRLHERNVLILKKRITESELSSE